MKIIIQAGGKGTRLEWLTHNKPKCIVPVDNLPIIFYLFKKYPNAEFKIISDYKSDVLKKYLNTFAKNYKFKIFKTNKKGTTAGINDVLKEYNDDEKVTIIWCDLILSEDFVLPSEKGNFIGISKDFECRWKYENKIFIEENSKEFGVAGLFIFEDKHYLKDLPYEGALVEWLQKQNINFKEIPMYKSKEVGTMLEYSELNENIFRCRPFNKIEFDGDIITKTGINEQGQKIAIDEINWYKHVINLGYENIPLIYDFNPLKMKLIKGKNIYEYDYITKSQKKEILSKLINAIKTLHSLEPQKEVVIKDVEDTYLDKTFRRLQKVKNLIPFAENEFIRINGKHYKNVFFVKDKLKSLIKSIYPLKFSLIHGDCTFSNMMFDTFDMKAVLIDPRGYFGETKFYGDEDYDWAKFYYSLNGDYDQFNLKKFTLDVKEDGIDLAIKSNNWIDMEDYFFEQIPEVNKFKIKLLHAIIWLSLTTYVWEDYDSILGAFYNGIIKLNDVL